MKLESFSVTNFRSITTANKLPINKSTILIGQNNEGKSNILNALAIAMAVIKRHSLSGRIITRRGASGIYDWDKDFPIQLQEKKPNGQTVFRIEFSLDNNEIEEFHENTKSSLNGTLPIEISIGNSLEPKFKILKKGRGGTSLSKKSSLIAKFIGSKIDFIYIPAIRTSKEALNVVEEMISAELKTLENNSDYVEAIKKISELQKDIFNNIAKKITTPLKEFIPQIKTVSITFSEEARYRAFRRSTEIIIDDGTPTQLEQKGDGVKSLVAISLLKGEKAIGRASILALEEPESHLHPSAIHRLRDVINDIAEDHQVVLSTHCPLFVDRVNISSNILITNNNAKPAKRINEIRELLGVKASDNLLHAKLALLVEGSDDKIALESLFSYHSPVIKKAISNGTFIIDELNGASNLQYKISQFQAAVCDTHCYVDNDDAGREAIKKAKESGLLKEADYQLCICNGMINSEIEDMYDVNIYKSKLETEFSIVLNTAKFKNNVIWSNRMRETFLSQGKNWNDSDEAKIKYFIAQIINQNPHKSLNEHKKSSFDALVKSLENKINNY